MRTERIYLKEYFPLLGENGCNAYVDCYLPDKMMDIQKFPCLVICPGGGYGMVSDREAEAIALKFLSDGYRVLVIHYSVAPHRFPQQLREVAGAMEILFANAEKWCADTANVAIMGFSAGAHLACQYSNRYDCPEIRAIFPQSKPVHKVVLSYPVITAEKPFLNEWTFVNLLGYEPESPDEEGCSCEHLVTERTPPTFLWHTAADEMVPVENSLIYARALSAAKVPFELHIYPYGNHGLATVDELTCVDLPEQDRRVGQWIEDCKTWLKLKVNVSQ